MEQEIVIVLCKFEDATLEQIQNLVQKNELLVTTLNDFIETTLPEDVEIFDRFDNILVTSNGYYCAFYEHDLKVINQN